MSSNMVVETEEDDTAYQHMVETMGGSKYRMKSQGVSMCSSATNFYQANTELNHI